MTLDDGFRSSADMVREAAADDARREHADYLEQREYESEEADAARWSHLMQRAAAERPVCWYDDGPDRRLHDWRAAIADGLEPDAQRDGAA